MVEALADAAIPPGKTLTRRAGPIAAEQMDSILAELPFLIRFALVAMYFALEWSAVLFTGRRFTRLSPEKRLRHLERWHAGSFGPRIALRGMLTPVKVAYFAEEDVAKALGYAPPPHVPRDDDGIPAGDIRVGSTRRSEEIHCDVAVVGTGAGGAVVAKELAERGRKVVMVEEGQFWTRPQFERKPWEMTRRMYRELGFTIALGRPGIPIPLGMTVGGTTTINSGTCFRVPERTIDKWRRLGLTEFTSGGLAHFYEKVEKRIRVQPVPEEVLGANAQIVARGARALGLHPQPLRRNADACRGSGVCCFGCPEDAKRSMNVTYVPDALAAGATLYTGTRAVKVQTEGGRAAGLLCEMGPDRTPLHVRADAVVVSAGTIYTPPFLQANGLRSPHIGRNLSIHPATKIFAFMPEVVRGHEGVPQGLMIDDLAAEGIMFEGIFVTPDYASIGFPSFGPKFTECMEKYEHLACFGFMVEDASQGIVKRGIDGRPLILYALGQKEIARIRKGMEVLCRLFFKAGAEAVFPPLSRIPELRAESDCDRLRDVKIIPEDLELSAFHPLGTCRMGADRLHGALDPDLESWEMDQLFVVDGSVFPSSLGVNPQLTIMAFATRAAERIDERLGGARRRWHPA